METTSLIQNTDRKEQANGDVVTRTTVLVHKDCQPALDDLRSHLADPKKAKALAALVKKLKGKKGPTNVAQVKQLSPFRYPGGKTWLVPEVRSWLVNAIRPPTVFVEPFAGGAMAGLTVAHDNLAAHVVLCELDEDVAAVWQTIFDSPDSDVRWLQKRITSFEVTLENVRKVLESDTKAVSKKAFRTIIKNRMQRGGIMAPGAGLIKEGEDGRGLMSRWYPDTLAGRIEVLRTLKDRITFVKGDAFEIIREHSDDPAAFFFVDPPYTAGGKRAGSRLYAHSEIDHEALFKVMAHVQGSVMLTYDDAPEVRQLAKEHKFQVKMVPMKNTHHAIVNELLILKS